MFILFENGPISANFSWIHSIIKIGWTDQNNKCKKHTILTEHNTITPIR